jgi:hypothetical protein
MNGKGVADFSQLHAISPPEQHTRRTDDETSGHTVVFTEVEGRALSFCSFSRFNFLLSFRDLFLGFGALNSNTPPHFSSWLR